MGGRLSVGRYALDEVIGVGSFATVHRATDDRLDATVVVKILAENHSLNPEVRERFIAEGRALRRVSSPHVVTLYDLGESERQQPYHVLEHADRGTLAQRVRELRSEGWTASAAEVLVLARQLATALTAVHRARLVHRDLSPANVLLTSLDTADAPDSRRAGLRLVREDEQVLVADLGMCKDLAINSGLTVAGGTTGFRAPEMQAGPAVVDGRADLYSLSALLAWVCEDADLPEALDRALTRGQATDPADRQQDVPAWLAEVEEALEPAPDVPASAAPEVPAHERRPARVRLVLAAALAALLLLVGGVVLGRATSGPPAATQTARIAISGPDEVTVGDQAEFTLQSTGVRSWAWDLPGGRYVTDEPSVTLRPTGPGRATVVVHATDAQGRELLAEHRLDVRADE
ncbi:Serine/threonine-protein kinase RIO1 [Serinicoccus hydrothermalis]|uniref:non-specific serine/threonine protein kinase n=1 Tax=Serinicoccus hydrothermalis TaxID=1758689 RepID=A0A1B1NFJ2_9MICO|nr:Serine/threonine-protein kinase RIO1 [Serinicoccus hydrothermalis]